MRIAFEDGSVHKSARVAFVGVAADILDVAFGLLCKLPLKTGRESSAAASAQSGFLDYVNDVITRKFGKALCKSLITVERDILVDVFGIDNAAVAKGDTLLLFVEIYLVERTNLVTFVNAALIEQIPDDAALEKMLVNDALNIIDLYVAVEGSLGVYDYDRTCFAKTEAARVDNAHFLFKTGFSDLFVEFFDYVPRAGRRASGTCTYENL